MLWDFTDWSPAAAQKGAGHQGVVYNPCQASEGDQDVTKHLNLADGNLGISS